MIPLPSVSFYLQNYIHHFAIPLNIISCPPPSLCCIDKMNKRALIASGQNLQRERESAGQVTIQRKTRDSPTSYPQVLLLP